MNKDLQETARATCAAIASDTSIMRGPQGAAITALARILALMLEPEAGR